MKPARESASSRPKPCASLKTPHEPCPVAAPLGRKMAVVRHQLFPQKPSGSCFPLARRRSSSPPPSPNLVRTHPIEHYQALRDSPPCLSRAATLPKGTKLELGRGRTPGNTILSQPYRRRVSTDMPNREGSQLAASLESEPGPTPPGKTLPHSYPKTSTPKPGFGGRV